jgi:hypothetical protein
LSPVKSLGLEILIGSHAIQGLAQLVAIAQRLAIAAGVEKPLQGLRHEEEIIHGPVTFVTNHAKSEPSKVGRDWPVMSANRKLGVVGDKIALPLIDRVACVIEEPRTNHRDVRQPRRSSGAYKSTVVRLQKARR